MHIARLAAASALILGLACSAAHAAIVPTPPLAQSFKIGDLEVAVVRDADILEPNNAKVFGLGVGPEAVTQVLTKAGMPGDAIPMAIDILVVKTAGRIVLLDSGIGSMGKGVLAQSLASIGIAADDVTDVFITHWHRDHTGGLVDAAGKPTFPNAVVRMTANEWATIQSKPTAKAQMAPVAPKVVTFVPGREVLPGITPVALYGHTPGHAGYRISSRGQSLLNVGDVLHSSVLSVQKPDWAEGYDDDKAAGAKARRAELKRLADSKVLMFAPHFPFPGIGRIEAAGDSFVWKAEPPR